MVTTNNTILGVHTSFCVGIQIMKVMRVELDNTFYFYCKSVGTTVCTPRNLQLLLGHVATVEVKEQKSCLYFHHNTRNLYHTIVPMDFRKSLYLK